LDARQHAPTGDKAAARQDGGDRDAAGAAASAAFTHRQRLEVFAGWLTLLGHHAGTPLEPAAGKAAAAGVAASASRAAHPVLAGETVAALLSVLLGRSAAPSATQQGSSGTGRRGGGLAVPSDEAFRVAFDFVARCGDAALADGHALTSLLASCLRWGRAELAGRVSAIAEGRGGPLPTAAVNEVRWRWEGGGG
jgi:hypothetical protein